MGPTSNAADEPQERPTQRDTPMVSLARLLSDVLARLPQDDHRLAQRALLAPQLTARDQDLAEAFGDAPPDAFGFLLVEGIVLKETTLATRSALELLTAGDVLAPTLDRTEQDLARAVSRYLAHGPVAVAVLGARFRVASLRWPEIGDDLNDRLAQQTHRASAHVAMLHQSRVEDRIALLFADLGERCGRMTTEGIVIDINLTHDVLGRLVGAQRPTVTLALQNLAGTGSLRRVETGRWLIPRDPAAA